MISQQGEAMLINLHVYYPAKKDAATGIDWKAKVVKCLINMNCISRVVPHVGGGEDGCQITNSRLYPITNSAPYTNGIDVVETVDQVYNKIDYYSSSVSVSTAAVPKKRNRRKK